jgi:IS30 family transposase
MDEFVEACSDIITELERNLGKKERYERAKQMRKNMKVRKERFAAPDKKMLKLVINNIMQKYQAQQHLTRAESGGR